MSEGSLKVLKVPVPNSSHFGINIQGHLVECLQFNAQIFQDSGIVTSPEGQQQKKIAIFIWMLIIETEQEENHEFIMVQTGQEFPMFDGELMYVDSALVPMPKGDIELHLFHAGKNDEIGDAIKEKIAEEREKQENSQS